MDRENAGSSGSTTRVGLTDSPQDDLDTFRTQWRQELQRNNNENSPISGLFAINNISNTSSSGINEKINSDVIRLKEAKLLPLYPPDQEIKTDSTVLRIFSKLKSNNNNQQPSSPSQESSSSPLTNSNSTLTPVCQLTFLPQELILHLFSFFPPQLLESFSLTCRSFYVFSRDPFLWRLHCYQTWAHQTLPLLSKYASWRQMFLSRPRLLFTGCYVSRNTYIRPGQRSELQITIPIHEVIYHRIFRFYPDNTVIMTMTFEDPKDVMSWFQKWWKGDAVDTAKGRSIRQGRWELDKETGDVKLEVGDKKIGGGKYRWYYWLKAESRKGGRGGMMQVADFYCVNTLTGEETDLTRDLSKMRNYYFVPVPKRLLELKPGDL